MTSSVWDFLRRSSTPFRSHSSEAEQTASSRDDRNEPLLAASSESPPSELQNFVRGCFTWLWKYAYYVVFLVLFWSACGVAASVEAVEDFTWQSWFTISIVCGALVLMANNCPPELVMLGITLILRLFDIITEEQAWYGFHSEGILAIGVLFVVAKSLEEAGTIESVVGIFLTNTSNVSLATFKLCLPVVVVSSVVNDTPVVAMMIPVVSKWAMKNGHAVSKFLIPLSFSAMLGGMCTLIGTSTNLILQELLQRDKEQGFDPGFELNMFSMTPVAAPVAGVAVLYMVLVGQFLLPGEAAQEGGGGAIDMHLEGSRGRRIYEMWFMVTQAGQGKTINELGVLRVPGARLLQIQHKGAGDGGDGAGESGQRVEEGDAAGEAGAGGGGEGGGGGGAGGGDAAAQRPPQIVTEVTTEGADGNNGGGGDNNGGEALDTDQRLAEGSMLLLECTADAITKIRKFAGIAAEPKSKLYSELGARRRHRRLVEVVLDRRCPLIGLPIDLADSLSLYNAAIFAIEDEERLRPGDTLLFETYPNFMAMYGDSDHFALVRLIEDSAPPRTNQVKDRVRKVVAGLIFLSCVVLAATKHLTLLVSMCCGAYLLVAIQCVTIDAAFMSIKGRVVLAVIAAFGLGDGLSNTNVTNKIAEGVVALGEQFGPNVLLFLICAATSCLSCLVSNQTTVIIVYGIVKTLNIPGVSIKELVITLIIGASSSFMTPFGYQTNLMVWRSGGYTFANYFRFGLPLTILNSLVATTVCRLLYAE